MQDKQNRIYWFGICNASTDHDALDSAQVADTHKIHPFLQPAATGLQ